jgi:YebC/PmpR family DNA-binding regulatory protein
MHEKGIADSKRSQVFSKLANELTIAAKEGGGGDPLANPRLRTVMEKAKEANMPSENVERAIKKATGGAAGQLEEILLEAYGPGGIALLISAITDNRNRTLGEIKQILQRSQGKMVEGGAVRWLFELKGVGVLEPDETHPLPKKEDVELLAIEAGAEDLYWHDDILDMYTDPANLASLKEKLEGKGLRVATSLGWVPKEHAQATPKVGEAIEQLFEALDEQNDVQDIYSNL